MPKKDIDWGSIGFGYIKTDKRFVANYKDGKWDDGALIDDENIVMNECACVLQYAQTCFEGLKAYTTEDGHIVCFRPDLNAKRMADSARYLEMAVYPEEKFVEAVEKDGRRKRRLGAALRLGCFAVSAPLYVRCQSGHRRKAGKRISVPYIRNTGRSVL